MATYILLLNWTQQGIENIKDSPQRLDQAKAAVRAAGGEITAFYMTLGQYDIVCVVEAPGDAALAKVMLELAAAGGIRSQTLKAFPENEYRDIIGGLS